MTKKEIKARLKPLERYLYTAKHADYIYGMTLSESKELFNIYNQVFNRDEKSFACAKCRIRIAKLLFDYVNKAKNKRNNDRIY